MDHDIGDRVTMTQDAIQNYGIKWEGVELVITHVSTEYMPAAGFFARGKPAGYHPGYDTEARVPLFDLKRADTGEELPMSLYAWEVI
jgi:hypothetical protein